MQNISFFFLIIIISDENQSSCEITYSIHDNADLTYTTPIRFTFYEEHDVGSWIEFLSEFLLELKEKDSDKFDLLLRDAAVEKIKKIICKNKNFFKKAQR